MHIVHVHIQVKPEDIDAFITATLENARNSVQEPGVSRFDFIQLADDPAGFVLVEVYKTKADAAKHKETAHYLRWRDSVAEMMARPRTGVVYQNLFPQDENW
jgi:quinol monooxygenase YgiN